MWTKIFEFYISTYFCLVDYNLDLKLVINMWTKIFIEVEPVYLKKKIKNYILIFIFK